MDALGPTRPALRFIAVLWRWLLDPEPREYPRVIIERGRPWDDEGYRTLFQLYYLPPGGEDPQHLGAVKVLERGVKKTELPSGELDALDERFCSLGQSIQYYERIRDLGQETAEAILLGLRDVALQPDILDGFAGDEGIAESLLRSLEAQTALHKAGALLNRQREAPANRESETLSALRFEFECLLKEQGFTEPHRMSIEFFPQDGQLGRVLCLVGKNATGKSAFLLRLARALSGLDREAGSILSGAPLLSRVIIIAYSAFDTYTYYRAGRPKGGTGYYYCGLRDENGQVDIAKAFQRTEGRLKRLHAGTNHEKWQEVLRRSGVLDTETHLAESFEASDFSKFIEEMKSLSSGHQIILFVLSNLMATIRPGSLILFDEPELHLHPNLLASLMRLLHAVLEDFQSYAILATHSPQIVQEIPARSVHIIERDGTFPSVRPYPRESFGANLGDIINLAFGVEDSDMNFERMLTDSARALGRDWLMHRVNEVLNRSLSLAPYALLRHLRESSKNGEET